jgi:hypothetical protein
MAKVSTFCKNFEDEFGVGIKCHKGMSKGHMADPDAKMHEICTGMDHNRDFDIELHGRMKVSTVEKEVADSMGFRVQILNPDGSNADNDSSLSDIRRAHA